MEIVDALKEAIGNHKDIEKHIRDIEVRIVGLDEEITKLTELNNRMYPKQVALKGRGSWARRDKRIYEYIFYVLFRHPIGLSVNTILLHVNESIEETSMRIQYSSLYAELYKMKARKWTKQVKHFNKTLWQLTEEGLDIFKGKEEGNV